MKTEEMADLLDGFASFTEKISGKSAMSDIRTVSGCLRQFSGETVASFCKFISQAKSGKPNQRKHSPSMDTDKVNAMIEKINHFLENKRAYEYPQIDELVDEFSTLNLQEIKSVGERMEGPTSSRTKAGLLKGWRNWLRSIKLSDDESANRFSEAAAAS